MSNGLMGNMLTEVVMEKAIRDKLKIQMADQPKPQKQGDGSQGQKQKKTCDSDDSDYDDLFDEEAEKIMTRMKLERFDDFNSQKVKKEQEEQGVGEYREIKEDEFLNCVTKNKYVVVHFYHKEFERCKIIDMHLRKIAQIHTECRFYYIDAEKCPFFITKLAIRTLPTIVCFIDGVSKDRIIGFNELGSKDDFKTIELTRRLVKSGSLKPLTQEEKGFRLKVGGRQDNDSDYSDDD